MTKALVPTGDSSICLNSHHTHNSFGHLSGLKADPELTGTAFGAWTLTQLQGFDWPGLVFGVCCFFEGFRPGQFLHQLLSLQLFKSDAMPIVLVHIRKDLETK